VYYCPKCKKNHKSPSSIYKDHIEYKKVEVEEVPFDKVIPYQFNNLPEVAQKQIKRYARKILLDKEHNYGKWKEVYIREINRIILRETPDSFLLK